MKFKAKWEIVASAACAIFFALLLVRILLPSNRQNGALDFQVVETDGVRYTLPRDISGYEDSVSQVTAENFARDGFLSTHLIPNRKGAPRVSLYDDDQTQCESVSPRGPAPIQWNGFGRRIENISSVYDCLHIHYPPLADWIFGALAAVGLGDVCCFRMLAALVSSLFLFFGFLTLKREVSPPAALVALLLTGTAAAWTKWADVLGIHSFQFFFLAAGMVSWSSYIERRNVRSFVVTWLLFFMESFVSYQLTLFFALMLLWSALPACRSEGIGYWIKRSAIQAAAPVSAFLGHLSLSVSLLGWSRVSQNLARTFEVRVGDIKPGGFVEIAHHIGAEIAHPALLVAGVGMVLFERRRSDRECKKAASLLGLMLIGAASFTLAFPGTASFHSTSMHRHLLLFFMFLVAFLTDGFFRSVQRLIRGGTSKERMNAFAAALLSLLLIGMVAEKNSRNVTDEIRWNAARNRSPDLDNLVHSRLDEFFWTEGRPTYQGNLLAPLMGPALEKPPGWRTSLALRDNASFHYEIWWLRELPMSQVTVTSEGNRIDIVRDKCEVSLLDGTVFTSLKETKRIVSEDTAMRRGWEKGLAEAEFSWSKKRSRAIRLSCSGLKGVTLYGIEVK